MARLLAVALLSSSTVAWAAEGSCPTSGQSGNPCGVATKQPTHLASGNRYAEEVDLPALPGTLGLEFKRFYNSNSADHVGTLGRGWRHSYDFSLAEVGPTVQVFRNDGKRLIFSRDPKSPSSCATSDPFDGQVLIEKAASGKARYRWLTISGLDYTFDERGLLESIRAPSGETTLLARGPKGELLTVTDPYGRTLRFSYADPRTSRHPLAHRGVNAVDTPLGRITYTHTPGDKLGAGNLVEVQAPGDVARRYVYLSDPALLGKGRRHAHLLTGIVALVKSGDGQIIEQPYATYAYDEQGRADYTARYPLEGGNVESTRLEFKLGETIITDEAGRQTRTKHTVVGDDYRLLEVTGPGCSLCPDAGWRYEWLPNGRLQQRTQLDAQGRVLRPPGGGQEPRCRTAELDLRCQRPRHHQPHARRQPDPLRL